MLTSDLPRTVDEAELAGWTDLELNCEGCRMLTYISWPRLRRRTGYRKLVDIKPRLVCSHCGKRPAQVWLHRTVIDAPLGTPHGERLEL